LPFPYLGDLFAGGRTFTLSRGEPMTLEGVIPALFTPYDADGNVSEEMLRTLVAHHMALGMNGFYVCGGAGEGVLLSPIERKKVVEAVVDEVGHRKPVIVHVGAVSTDSAADLAVHAEKAGADAIASVPPFFYPATTEAIFQHYSAIGNRCGLPLLVYNIPALTRINVTPPMMARLLQIPTVAGIKFSHNDLYELRQMVELDPARLTVMSGNDEIFLPALVMGAQGAIGLTLNFMPKLFLEIWLNFRCGQMEKARTAQFPANRIISVLIQFSSIPAGKEILRFRGYDCGGARGPLERLSEHQKKTLREKLEVLGFFDLDVGTPTPSS